jgi:hypothetical protein
VFGSARPKVRLCGGGIGLKPLAVGASAGLPELALKALFESIVTRVRLELIQKVLKVLLIFVVKKSK